MNVDAIKGFLSDRTKVAKYVFALDTVLGIASIGGAALYIAAISTGSVWQTFLKVFLSASILWTWFCYGAYRGLRSENAILKILFWLDVVGNIFVFPVGTAIAGVLIWLWRELRSPNP